MSDMLCIGLSKRIGVIYASCPVSGASFVLYHAMQSSPLPEATRYADGYFENAPKIFECAAQYSSEAHIWSLVCFKFETIEICIHIEINALRMARTLLIVTQGIEMVVVRDVADDSKIGFLCSSNQSKRGE
jgi:hypothetical protein